MLPGTACRARSSRDVPFPLRRPVALVLARLLLASTLVPPSVVCPASLNNPHSGLLLLTLHQRVARPEAVSEETDTETTGADTAVAAEVATTTVVTVATATATTVEATTVATVTTAEDTIEDTVTTVEDTTAVTATIVEATTAETETSRVVAGSTATPPLDAMTATAAVEEARDSTVLLLAMRPRLAATARVRVTIPCPAMVVTELSRCRPPCALSNFASGVAPRYFVHGRSSRLL